MRIAYITAGAAGTICGNCLRDNALASALIADGHDVLLLPAYTPIRTDETDVSDQRVVFSGINMYMQGKYPFFRKSRLFDFVFDSPRLLAWASKFGVDTHPEVLGTMTLATMQGEQGPHAREMAKLIAVLREFRPEIVHLTNSMFVCMAVPIRRELGVPVVCALQGEDYFLSHLPDPYCGECFRVLQEHAHNVDLFIGPCRDHAETFAPLLGIDASEIAVVLPGIDLDGFKMSVGSGDSEFTIGYLARISEEKGLHILAAAVTKLRESNPVLDIKLRVAGFRGENEQRYLDGVAAGVELEDAGYLARDQKFEFLAGLDAFSVPTVYGASKGLYVLEALAAGVPVVEPRIGVFPELIDATGGGLLCEPNNPEDLAAKLQSLIDNRENARALGVCGRDAVEQRFRAARMAEETTALYRQQLK